MLKTLKWVKKNDKETYQKLEDKFKEISSENNLTQKEIDNFYEGKWVVKYEIKYYPLLIPIWDVIIYIVPNEQALFKNLNWWVKESFGESKDKDIAERIKERFPFLSEEIDEIKKWIQIDKWMYINIK